MFDCNGCGGPLRFDPSTQKMLCAYCGNSYEVDSLNKNNNAIEDNEYDVTLFTCPQCGGQLGGVETSSAEFCSFCGTPLILNSRMSHMKSPKYIIPFKKSKEASVKALHKHLRKAFFTPNGFKNAKIDSVRGIYIPTWTYDIEQKGNVTLEVNEEERKLVGDSYNSEYALTSKIDVLYEGIPHDASEDFADRISETLEPYEYKDRKPFNAAYVAGFFSDILDVDSSRYKEDAINMANEHTYNELLNQVDVGYGELKEVNEKGLTSLLHTKVRNIDNVLIPVWFFAYRNKNRVAYAAVNGETGKVVSDLPIDIKKIWFFAFLLALPIFALLNMNVSMTATTLLMTTLIILACVNALYCYELMKVDDLSSQRQWDKAERKNSKKGKPKRKHRIKPLSFLWILLGVTCFIPAVIVLICVLFLGIAFASVALAFAVAAAILAGPVLGFIQFLDSTDFFQKLVFFLLLIAGVSSLAILIYEPVSDLYYYGATIFDLFVSLYAFSIVWASFNEITTRPLPQLKKRDGDQYA